ncbi:hypothetical protein [Nocardioides marmoraquaticus]
MDDIKDRLDALRLDTQADVQTMWELLMRPLGFASHSIWICLVDDRGAPLPQLTQVGDGDGRLPRPKEVAALCDMVGGLASHLDGVDGVAFLISRPGASGLTDADRRIAAQLYSGARAAGLRCEPVHVADDREVVAVAPDDLAAA